MSVWVLSVWIAGVQLATHPVFSALAAWRRRCNDRRDRGKLSPGRLGNAETILLALLLATGCDSRSTSTGPSVDQKVGSATPQLSAIPTDATSSVSKEATDTLIGLIADSRLHPNTNAVDTFAAGFHWRKTPPETNALLNAKVGYAGNIAGQTAIVGGDGTNDIFAIALRDGFQPAEVIAELTQVYTLNKQDSEDSDGQRYDTYILVDHGDQLGLLTLTYGRADAIRGTGTIAFVAMDRARREIAAHKGEP